LFEAVQNDGVEYLAPLEDRWGEIAQYPDLINEYADRMIGMVRRAWADRQTFQHVIGTSICLSCLLEGGRYDELHELLATRRMKSWSSHRFGAEALVRQGLWEGAIAFAEAVRSKSLIGPFCTLRAQASDLSAIFREDKNRVISIIVWWS
jgi:hypothetical protein